MTLLKTNADGETRLESIVTRHYEFMNSTFPTAASIENFESVSLGEGNTPIVKAGPAVTGFLAEHGMAGIQTYFKLEWCNPTGSFKDRGMAVAVAKAKEEGCKTLICASTGNTSASAAAYGKRAGLDVMVIIPQSVPEAKIMQAAAYGARIIKWGENFDEAQAAAIWLAQEMQGARLVNSINPHRIEGQKTAAFEISNALGNAPDYFVIPVGNAGNITAYWRGFEEYKTAGRNSRMPVMVGARATEGTEAQAIAIKEPKNRASAYNIARQSEGIILENIPDEEMRAAHSVLRKDGMLTELASAITLASLPHYTAMAQMPPGSKVVMILTGNGLKDMGISMRYEIIRPTAATTESQLLELAIS